MGRNAYVTTSKPISIATSSSAATAGSRTSGASQRATTNSLGTTSRPCASLPPWHSGFNQLSLDPSQPRSIACFSAAPYSPTEILDYLVKTHRSRLAGLPDFQKNPTLVVAVGWVVGRAFRYLLAGT